MKVEASELITLEQDADGVTASIKSESGETESIRAKILYGADGAKGWLSVSFTTGKQIHS